MDLQVHHLPFTPAAPTENLQRPADAHAGLTSDIA